MSCSECQICVSVLKVKVKVKAAPYRIEWRGIYLGGAGKGRSLLRGFNKLEGN